MGGPLDQAQVYTGARWWCSWNGGKWEETHGCRARSGEGGSGPWESMMGGEFCYTYFLSSGSNSRVC